MLYIKRTSTDGTLASVRSVSEVPPDMAKYIQPVTLGKDESFITQAEFNTYVEQIRTT